MYQHYTILGAGSWGTALAAHLARLHAQVVLWGRNPEQIAELQKEHCNQRYLPDIRLPASLSYTDDLAAATRSAGLVVVATPSHHFATLLTRIHDFLPAGATVVWACKGISDKKLLDQIATEQLPDNIPIAVLSGPSFAAELATGLPTAVTIAAPDLDTAADISQCFHGDRFRAYPSDDMTGVQIAGALKNVYAIAAGISDGLGFGANARSALITRGLAELMRLGDAMGARRDTLMGLAGVGDLVLTCTDNQSRNRRFGLALGQGLGSARALESIGQTVEGINTCDQAMLLASEYQVDMPITTQVYRVVHEQLSPDAAVSALLSRALTTETR